jgi:hypothetical protein
MEKNARAISKKILLILIGDTHLTRMKCIGVLLCIIVFVLGFGFIVLQRWYRIPSKFSPEEVDKIVFIYHSKKDYKVDNYKIEWLGEIINDKNQIEVHKNSLDIIGKRIAITDNNFSEIINNYNNLFFTSWCLLDKRIERFLNKDQSEIIWEIKIVEKKFYGKYNIYTYIHQEPTGKRYIETEGLYDYGLYYFWRKGSIYSFFYPYDDSRMDLLMNNIFSLINEVGK